MPPERLTSRISFRSGPLIRSDRSDRVPSSRPAPGCPAIPAAMPPIPTTTTQRVNTATMRRSGGDPALRRVNLPRLEAMAVTMIGSTVIWR